MSVVVLNKRTAPSLLTPGTVFGRLTATSEYKMRQRPAVRAPRMAQALPVTDGKEVIA